MLERQDTTPWPGGITAASALNLMGHQAGHMLWPHTLVRKTPPSLLHASASAFAGKPHKVKGCPPGSGAGPQCTGPGQTPGSPAPWRLRCGPWPSSPPPAARGRPATWPPASSIWDLQHSCSRGAGGLFFHPPSYSCLHDRGHPVTTTLLLGCCLAQASLMSEAAAARCPAGRDWSAFEGEGRLGVVTASPLEQPQALR